MTGTSLGVLEGATEPQPGEHAVPPCVRLQVTPLLAGSFCTVAVSGCFVFTTTLACTGETEIDNGGVTVTVSVADLLGSATAVAVTVALALLATLAGARGHFTFAGTPEQVADLIEDWFTDGAADGFNIMPPLLPAMLDVFSAEVIPLLQRRGLFRTAYEGKTLREHYGLAWPKGAFKEAALQEA